MNIGGNLGNLVNDLLGGGKENDADAQKAEAHEAEHAGDETKADSGWMMDRGEGEVEAAPSSPFEGLGDISPELRESIKDALEEAEVTGMTADMGDNVGGLAEDVSDAMKDIDDNLSHMSGGFSDAVTTMDIGKAAETLREVLPQMREEFALKAENGTITPEEADISDVVNSPFGPVVLKSLQDGGVNEIDLEGMPTGTSTELGQSILEASANAHTQNNLPSPQAAMDAAYEAQAHAHEAVHAVQQTPEYDYSHTHEDDHSAGL